MPRAVCFRLLCFFLCFTLELKLKAQDSPGASPSERPQTPGLLQEPRACLRGAGDCSIGVLEKSFELKGKGLHLVLPEGSILSRKFEEWKLLSGPALVHGLEKGANLFFQLGKITSLSKSSSFLLRPVDPQFMSWRIQVTRGEVSVDGGSGKSIILSEGFELLVKGYDADGELLAEIPQVLDVRGYASFWGALFSGSRQEFIAHMKSLRQIQQTAIELSSLTYRETIHRRVAVIEEERRLKAEAQARKDKETAALQALFRKKNHLDF